MLQHPSELEREQILKSNTTEISRTWDSFDCSEEIKDICYRNVTLDDIKKELHVTNGHCNIKDKRDFVQMFLDKFMANYNGQMEISEVLTSLIVHTEKFPAITRELQWLECTKQLQRDFITICNERDIHGLISYFKGETDQFSEKLSQCPDDSMRVMFVMSVVLKNPSYYEIFRAFCRRTPSLLKYIHNAKLETNKLRHVSKILLPDSKWAPRLKVGSFYYGWFLKYRENNFCFFWPSAVTLGFRSFKEKV